MTELTKEQQQEVKKEVEKQVGQATQNVEKKVEKQIIGRLIGKLTHTTGAVHSEFKHHTATAIIAAFGFLIALVWKDLIVKIMENVTSAHLLEQYPYLSLLFSAFVVTIFSVFGIIIVSRWAKKPDSK